MTEFWRRWHISLSTWFRDYLYIPFGGSRCGKLRTCFNGMAVFALCGLWHGAGTVFVLWGLWHGLFLSAERLVRVPDFRGKAAAGRVYAAAVVLAGWLLFRSESFSVFSTMLRSLCGAAPADEARILWIDASPRFFLALAAGLALSQPGLLSALRPSASPEPRGAAARCAQWLALTALGLVALLFVAGGSYHSFIYFRF